MFKSLDNKDEIKFQENKKSEEGILYEEEYKEKNQGYWADIDLIHDYYEEDDFVSTDEELKELIEKSNRELEQIRREIYLDELKYAIKLNPSMISDKERCVVIVAINVVQGERGKQYLKIIGIDVLSAKIVSIVDTNGLDKLLHSYSLKLLKLSGKMTTIKAKFQYYDTDRKLNVLRIVSDFFIVGQQPFKNLYWLNKKYEEVIVKDFVEVDKRGLVYSFSIIKEFTKYNLYEEGYFIGNFTGTKVKKHENNGRFKYQLMMQIAKRPEFLDIHDNDINISEKEGLNYRGYALCKWQKFKNGKVGFIAIKLYGDFLIDNEYEDIKKKNKQIKCSQNSSDNSGDFIPYMEMDEVFEKNYDEYSDSFLNSIDRNEEYDETDEQYEEAKESDDMYWFSDDEYIEEEW